jgi:hypothetical protein
VNKQSITALLQVIQIAAGISNQPHITIVGETLTNASIAASTFSHTLLSYLQKAGLKSSISISWGEVYQNIQEQQVDVIVLELQNATTNRKSLWRGLRQIAQFPVKPPLIVVDRRCQDERSADPELDILLQEVATKIVSHSDYGCAEILIDIHQVLPQHLVDNV